MYDTKVSVEPSTVRGKVTGTEDVQILTVHWELLFLSHYALCEGCVHHPDMVAML